MKKLIVHLLVAMILLSLAGCSRFHCDFCGKDKFGKVNTVTFFGENMNYCNTCKNELKELADDLPGLVN